MTSKGKKASKREERRRVAQAKARRKRRIVWSSVGILVVAVVAIIVFNPLPEELADVETFADMGGGHLAQGEAPPAYNSSPATSGEHSATSAQCGIYTSEIADSAQLHSLEHGTVAIHYEPGLDPGQIRALQDFARSKSSHILLAPRAGLTDPVVVTSWRRMLRLDSADINTLDIYYNQFAFTGPEVGVPCPFAVDESL